MNLVVGVCTVVTLSPPQQQCISHLSSWSRMQPHSFPTVSFYKRSQNWSPSLRMAWGSIYFEQHWPLVSEDLQCLGSIPLESGFQPLLATGALATTLHFCSVSDRRVDSIRSWYLCHFVALCRFFCHSLLIMERKQIHFYWKTSIAALFYSSPTWSEENFSLFTDEDSGLEWVMWGGPVGGVSSFPGLAHHYPDLLLSQTQDLKMRSFNIFLPITTPHTTCRPTVFIWQFCTVGLQAVFPNLYVTDLSPLSTLFPANETFDGLGIFAMSSNSKLLTVLLFLKCPSKLPSDFWSSDKAFLSLWKLSQTSHFENNSSLLLTPGSFQCLLPLP